LSQQPLVTVVIPHYDRSELLARCVASVLASTEQNIEVIIVDDGSSRPEWECVERLNGERVRTIRRVDGPKGPSRCRNLGTRESAAEMIVFLDSDDLMAPWCIETRLAAVRAAPEADLWIFPVLLFNEVPGDRDILWNSMEADLDPSVRFLRSDPPWHTSSPLWKKSALLRIGGFNEELIYGDDSDLHYRALHLGLAPALFANMLPDIFVRRSSVPRITNSLTAEIITSRLRRLREGAKFLRTRPHPEHAAIWEGQYFVEGEFLLFNDAQPSDVRAVLKAWEGDFASTALRKAIVRMYFEIGIATRHRAYLVLRVARRAAMMFLPPNYFPIGGTFHSATINALDMDKVRSRLVNSAIGPQD
jgi:glycosyltransferase involved in cell wall biosynthesis